VTILHHDNFLAELDVDEDAGVMHGRVINTVAVLTFEGETLPELKKAFADTIADYRDWCKERGVKPEKPYQGNISLRLTPDLHRRVAEMAAKADDSINGFIAHRLAEIAA
jgi:predicted HicB family RNase H-like nuclease